MQTFSTAELKNKFIQSLCTLHRNNINSNALGEQFSGDISFEPFYLLGIIYIINIRIIGIRRFTLKVTTIPYCLSKKKHQRNKYRRP